MKLKIGDRVHHVDDIGMEGTILDFFVEPGRVIVRWDNGVDLNQFEKEIRKIPVPAVEAKPKSALNDKGPKT